MLDELMINGYIHLFFLIFSRYLGMMFLTPVFGSRVILYQVKILIVLSLTVLTFPLVAANYTIVNPDSNLLVVVEIISEASIGLFMGFSVFLVFSAIQLAGQIIDMRMGFRIANVVDPFSGVDSPVIGQLKNIFVTLIFLALNGHLFLIKHLYQSFEIIPPGRVNFSSELWQYFFRRSADMFVLAVKIALPIAGAIFFIDIILAFLARSVPQMNLFVVGIPVKIMAGLILLFILMPVLNSYYAEVIMKAINEIPALFRLIAP
ncbi:flagellar biosynthetic protein FliR [Halanaerobium saccharolyticum]|uniref:Flagellar biosynthetic protein FliR n=1 Tax=Halanaerobium saccharolyticum TaxID=43595 RepID=A0A4R6RR66_9FIRM|nr:flagellar biosynthetic protein FliR [Halanaerobium saccharolyticum]TDP89240.1 flagellar biosynthetic protein FliR [Halanaerobium saccharolyticum]